jgi:hypothetical protein
LVAVQDAAAGRAGHGHAAEGAHRDLPQPLLLDLGGLGELLGLLVQLREPVGVLLDLLDAGQLLGGQDLVGGRGRGEGGAAQPLGDLADRAGGADGGAAGQVVQAAGGGAGRAAGGGGGGLGLAAGLGQLGQASGGAVGAAGGGGQALAGAGRGGQFPAGGGGGGAGGGDPGRGAGGGALGAGLVLARVLEGGLRVGEAGHHLRGLGGGAHRGVPPVVVQAPRPSR